MSSLLYSRKNRPPGQLQSPSEFSYARLLIRRLPQRDGTTMADHKPLVRQWLLLKILSANRYGRTVQELVDEMKVSAKTIRRDLETFQSVGFPLKEVVGDFGRKKWHLEVGKHESDLNFAFDEAIALYLGRRFLEPLAGTLFWDAAQRAFKKIRAMLGPKAIRYMEQFAQVFHQTTLGANDYADKAELIDELMQGIEGQLAVFITYQSQRATEPVTYDVHPYGLIYHRGALYLVGMAVQHNEIRHWKVSRIENADLTKVRFERPREFDLQKHLAGSFGVFHADGDVRLKVRFAANVARYVAESQWHSSQKLTPQKDGSLVAEFRLSGTEEFKRWVMSFGAAAVVLEPAKLRDEVTYELKALFSLYDRSAKEPADLDRPAQSGRRTAPR